MTAILCCRLRLRVRLELGFASDRAFNGGLASAAHPYLALLYRRVWAARFRADL